MLQVCLVGAVGTGELALGVEGLAKPKLGLGGHLGVDAGGGGQQVRLGAGVVAVAELADAQLVEHELAHGLLLGGQARYLVEVLQGPSVVLVTVVGLC